MWEDVKALYIWTSATSCHDGHSAARMTDQEIVNHIARLAKPRLLELLKLTVPHLYDPRPGRADTKSEANDSDVGLKLVTTVQPYGDIQRFVTEDKVMGFVVNPCLVPLIKVIAFHVRDAACS